MATGTSNKADPMEKQIQTCKIETGQSVAASVRDSPAILSSPQKNRVIMNETERALQAQASKRKGLRLGPGPVPSCAKMGVMLFLRMIFLPSMYCDIKSEYYSSYEIVIPQSLTAKGREDPGEEASYMLHIQGQKQVIHLKVKKDYFVSNFPVFSYHNGILGQEVSFVSQDCHHEGYIEGAPGSFVSVSLCSGLKGILIKEGQSYGIEPMESSKHFEHVLYTMAHQAPGSCSVTSDRSPGVSTSQQRGTWKPRHRQAPSYLWSHTKYVEMFIVVNHRRFQMWGSNVSETIQGVMDIIALANSFTKGINTEVVLAGMEIWTEGDLIEVPVDLQVALRNFNRWRQQKLFQRVKHDVAHLIVGHHPGQNVGRAFLNGACSGDFAAAVESFHHEDVLLFAALMVHELGHNLGIEHDHSACICKDKYFCLMHQNITKESGFSNCSSNFFYQFLRDRKGACLFNKPGHKGRTRRDAICGNGVVEDMEECDCGPICDSHPCCDPICKLKPGTQCSEGLCCSECQLRKKGYMCRPAGDECDLPEYCHGDSEECPTDTYKQDGTPCDRTNYCFRGQCKNPDKQCVAIYGHQARSASEDCYQSMNSRGDRFGNCGRPSENDPVYIKCIDDDIFCGKLVCTDITYLPSIKPLHTLIQVPYEDNWCWSMDVFNGSDIPDEGDIRPGTYCAPNKVCMNHSCVDHAVLNYSCKPAEMCNGKGVCNNLRHCHCEPGFAPPDCRAAGDGGSVDSGPPTNPDAESRRASERRIHSPVGANAHRRDENENENQSLGKTVHILPLFLIVLFLGLLIFAILRDRKQSSETQQESVENAPEAAPEEPAPEEEVAIDGGQEEQEAEND
ncbi:disintegrin and metalloproteinase domain-containing protein 1a-like [Orycteropus afer afer]|uniref:Disintegrin and metalloproteinase domain-containing protein 1a-like n=1 Tax=Orycteropus afer afer TaxID=1230840 RepID=A0AC54Z5G6_ORYAF|nr:disintegrin and metalloproteinase domain-containing protein 1a-like [Orycteropus afer afer]